MRELQGSIIGASFLVMIIGCVTTRVGQEGSAMQKVCTHTSCVSVPGLMPCCLTHPPTHRYSGAMGQLLQWISPVVVAPVVTMVSHRGRGAV
jgi:hypothetical protein